MTINLVSRLKKLESKLSSTPSINKGYKYFYAFDDHTYYYQSTLPAGIFSPMKATLIDYRKLCKGCDGKADPNDQVFTPKEVEKLGREGWRCLIIKWAEMS